MPLLMPHVVLVDGGVSFVECGRVHQGYGYFATRNASFQQYAVVPAEIVAKVIILFGGIPMQTLTLRLAIDSR